MSENPYEAPRIIETSPSWLERIGLLWNAYIPDASRRSLIRCFLAGRRLVHYGVIFNLPVTDPTRVVAGLPLVADDDEHRSRNIAEAQRVLRELLTIYPELNKTLRGRTLEVEMFSDYQSTEILRHELIAAEQWESFVPSDIDPVADL